MTSIGRLHLYTCLLLALYASELSAAASSDFYCTFRVVGYYPDYSHWTTPQFTPRYDKLTHVMYFSIYPNADGSLNLSEIDLTRQQNIVQTAHSQNTNVCITAGGWGLSQYFSPMAASPATRTAFVSNLVQYCLDHSLDGVDLDWEPVTTAIDRDNYTLLIQQLSTALTAHDLTLSVAVAALGREFHPQAITALDWITVMAYDMGTPHSAYDDAIAALAHWEAFGVPSAQLVLGVPFYGRDLNGSHYPYKEIVQQYAPAPNIDEIAGIHFNGIDTIKRKTAYVTGNQHGGIAAWQIALDTDDATSLLTAATDRIHLGKIPDFDCNHRVDFADLNHFADHWLESNCTTANAWCNAADIDQSQMVDLQDLTLLMQFWLQDAID